MKRHEAYSGRRPFGLNETHSLGIDTLAAATIERPPTENLPGIESGSPNRDGAGRIVQLVDREVLGEEPPEFFCGREYFRGAAWRCRYQDNVSGVRAPRHRTTLRVIFAARRVVKPPSDRETSRCQRRPSPK